MNYLSEEEPIAKLFQGRRNSQLHLEFERGVSVSERERGVTSSNPISQTRIAPHQGVNSHFSLASSSSTEHAITSTARRPLFPVSNT
jgi:hypothetical protein